MTYDTSVPAGSSPPGPVTARERVEALRPSRYCPSDGVVGLARGLFGGAADPAGRVRAICDHVRSTVAYAPGCSGPTTDGVDTLLSGEGVCRDFAHVVAMLCRAVDIPARVVSVYAPGLSPMDLHAVVETELGGCWWVWDATGLAPRQTLVRIATGRDAADTAFATVVSGEARLQSLEVTAVAPGSLPVDDHRAPVWLS
jgi:transglutaminase-like putative cysteine protease